MALDIRRPIEVARVRDEERLFGGDIVWWLLLLIVSLPIMLWSLGQIPQTSGFVFLSLSTIAAGVAFAQVAMRLPYLTNHFLLSIVIAAVALTVIGVIALIYTVMLPVPTAPLDVMYKPPISGG
ncbi:MAG TPA: hypothetical protein VGQ62_02390 [Chloroflexota bacterium]|nr:hypothetical protein [Chloroflexota bacterium]